MTTAFASARSDRYRIIQGIANIKLDLFDCSMNNLSLVIDSPESQELVEAKCHHCETIIECRRIVAPFIACDSCIARKTAEDRTAHHKDYWASICPPSFADTDRQHAGFPKAQYEQLKSYLGETSLLLFGDTGTGKSRLAVMLLKRCLHQKGAYVGILWPEVLKRKKWARDTGEFLDKWGKYDLLLLDDALLTGAQDERITDVLKDLLDYRMRYKRPVIITSQVGSEDYKKQADKFDNITAADHKRVDALLRRIKEICEVIPFVKVEPQQGESAF